MNNITVKSSSANFLFDKFLEWISALALAAVWKTAFIYFPRLPEEIPVHFDLNGHADGYSSKYFIFMLPFIAALIFLLLSYLSRHPENISYPVKIEADNAERQYRIAVRFLRILKLNISVVFMLIIFAVIQTIFMKIQGPENGYYRLFSL